LLCVARAVRAAEPPNQAAFAGAEKRRGPRRDRRAQELSRSLQATLQAAVLAELLPRSQVGVCVTVLRRDGGERACACNAALAALADAGVPLRDTAGACAAALLDGVPAADPAGGEEGKGALLEVVLLPCTDALLLVAQEGQRVPLPLFEQLLARATDGARAVAAFTRSALLQHTVNRSAAGR